jgi:hypothetical protein
VNLETERFSMFVDELPVLNFFGSRTANMPGDTNFLEWRMSTPSEAVNRFGIDDIIVQRLMSLSASTSLEGAGGVLPGGEVIPSTRTVQVAGGEHPLRSALEFPKPATGDVSLASLQFELRPPPIGKSGESEPLVGLELRHYIPEPDGILTADDYDDGDTRTESLGIIVMDVASVVERTTVTVDVTEAAAGDLASGYSHIGFQLRLTDESQTEVSVLLNADPNSPSGPRLLWIQAPVATNIYDLTGDGAVDHHDLCRILHSARHNRTTPGDFTADESVDHEDLFLFSIHWEE